VTIFRQFKRAVFKVDEEAAIICISDSEEIEDYFTQSQSVSLRHPKRTMICISDSEEIEDYCTQSERLRKDKEDDTFSDILKVGVKRAAVVVTMGV
jgi:hypothetical protein